MRRIITRLIIFGVIAGIGWIGYQLADFTKCGGPKVVNWLDTTGLRLDAYHADWESTNDYTSSGTYRTLAAHAQERYDSQIAEELPSCLTDLQEHATDLFSYEIKSYESLAAGDIDMAMSYFSKEEAAFDSLRSETERPSLKYGWDE